MTTNAASALDDCAHTEPRTGVQGRRHDEEDRVDLRRRRQAEQQEGGHRSTEREREQRADRQRGRPRVVRVEPHAAEQERADGDEAERKREPSRPGAELDEQARDAPEPAERDGRHQELEEEAVVPVGHERRRQEHDERPRRVLDERVAVGDRAVEKALRVPVIELEVDVGPPAEQATRPAPPPSARRPAPRRATRETRGGGRSPSERRQSWPGVAGDSSAVGGGGGGSAGVVSVVVSVVSVVDGAAGGTYGSYDRL